jgi:hypothetical protein
MKSSKHVDLWPMECDFPRNYPPYITSSMSLNSRNVSRFPQGLLNKDPIKVLDQKESVTRRKVIKMYKIQWSHHTEEEAM